MLYLIHHSPNVTNGITSSSLSLSVSEILILPALKNGLETSESELRQYVTNMDLYLM